MSKSRRPGRVAAGLTQTAAGPGPTVEAAGRVWRRGVNTQNAKAALEELVRAHVLRESRLCGPEEYQETRDRVLGGYYRTLERGWVSIVNSPAGTVLYLQSLLLKHQPDATAEDAAALLSLAPDETAAALEEVSPDFFGAVAREWAAARRLDAVRADAVAAQVAAQVAAAFRGPTTPAPATASA